MTGSRSKQATIHKHPSYKPARVNMMAALAALTFVQSSDHIQTPQQILELRSQEMLPLMTLLQQVHV